MRELETGQDQGPRHRCSAIVAEAARLLITLGYEPLVRLTIRVRSVGCGRGLDVIEECLEYQVMQRLDPLTPDRLVLPGRAALKRVAQNGRSEEHTSEFQSHVNLVCRLLLEKKKKTTRSSTLKLKNTKATIIRTYHLLH